jgi:hypothetical protein
MTTLTYFKGLPPKVKTAIKNKKNCNDCRYHSAGRCTLFIGLNKDYYVDYPSTYVVRSDTGLCGPDAKYFKEKINIIFK